MTSTFMIEVRVVVGLDTQTTTVLVPATPDLSFTQLDAVVGKELVHGDLIHHTVLEHFWLIKSKTMLKENLLWQKREKREESRSPGGCL